MLKVGQQVRVFCDNIPMYAPEAAFIKSIGPKWITTTTGFRIPTTGTHKHFTFKAV